jgi:hypothetical protein
MDGKAGGGANWRGANQITWRNSRVTSQDVSTSLDMTNYS